MTGALKECPGTRREADRGSALWRAGAGPSLPEKTAVNAHLSEGFDFLGQNIRQRYPNGKLLIKTVEEEHASPLW